MMEQTEKEANILYSKQVQASLEKEKAQREEIKKQADAQAIRDLSFKAKEKQKAAELAKT